MPEEGENAIDKVATWISKLNTHAFAGRHPLLGETTACVTTIGGGENINSVPDTAEFTIDFRTLPEQDHGALLSEIGTLFGAGASIEVVTSFPGFSTEPDDVAAATLMRLLRSRTGHAPAVRGAPYFTDASALVPAFDNVATAVLGPGEATQCHKTDEFCYIARIVEAEQIHQALMRGMCLTA